MSSHQGPASRLASHVLRIDVDLLPAKLCRQGTPDFMTDPAGAAEIIGRMCAPRQSDRYATLTEALEDLAILES